MTSQLGPRPEGDPAAMRAVASKLSHAAGQIASAAAPAGKVVAADAFRGPGRSAVDDGMRRVQSLGRAAAGSLETEAATLMREAGELHEKQLAWERQKKHLEHVARERARLAREQASR